MGLDLLGCVPGPAPDRGQGEAQVAGQRAGRLEQPAAAEQADQAAVEPQVRRGGRRRVARPGGCGVAVEGGSQRLDRLRCGGPGGPHARPLEQLAGLEDLFDVGHRERGDLGAATRGSGEQALGREDRQRLAHRRARHAERPGQRHLAQRLPAGSARPRTSSPAGLPRPARQCSIGRSRPRARPASGGVVWTTLRLGHAVRRP